MSTVQEIQEVCATRLGVNERAALLEWLREFDDDWDQQIADDAAAGRLNHLFEEAKRDFEAGRCTPL